ncbi:MAG: DNA helicase RecQ [Sphingomicrobium sp.]
MSDPLEILKRVFGFDQFRGVQDVVIERVLAGRDTLAVMPTGAGKSLCYQLPAIARNGTALVISPLIALMHDQIRSATAIGLKAASLTSADSDRDRTVERFLAGELDLLYVAPERATTDSFRQLLARAQLALIAIDEAHCVSEWGHDFRPDYRLLRPLLDEHSDVPRLALTATADARTRADILAQLGIPPEGLVIAGFDRPNIRYHVRPREQTGKQLRDLLATQPGPAIVYAPSRDKTEKIAAALASNGRPALPYHAGLEPQIRARNQAAFVNSEDLVIAATVAFGMGIDKADVRVVAHAGIPKSIEAFYQETGRAGRDGEPAEAWLFWAAQDFARARQRIEQEVEPDRRPAERERLNALASLVEATTCRRAILLRHFGEDPPPSCGNCDNCLAPPATLDATETARKLLSAAFRTDMRFGVAHLAAVLGGDDSEKVRQFGHHRLSVFGIATADELALIRPVSRALIARDALRADAYGGLSFGPAAKAILKGEEQVTIALPPVRKRGRRQRSSGPADPRFEALREARRELAAQAGVPPYVVFHDSTLREIAERRPASLGELAQVSGVGETKLARYGEAMLTALRGTD